MPTDEGKSAASIAAAFFPDGLKFTQLPYKQEWAEADLRLRVLEDKPDYEKTVKKLGGEPFLVHLREAHKEYGDALGVTTARASDEQPKAAAIREAMTPLLDAIRTYAIRVMAHADPDDEAASSLSEGLLLPLRNWEDGRKASRTVAETPADSTPLT